MSAHTPGPWEIDAGGHCQSHRGAIMSCPPCTNTCNQGRACINVTALHRKPAAAPSPESMTWMDDTMPPASRLEHDTFDNQDHHDWEAQEAAKLAGGQLSRGDALRTGAWLVGWVSFVGLLGWVCKHVSAEDWELVAQLSGMWP